MKRYVTTAIDYPNAAPHMGHVLEKVLADVAARWFRLKGDDVRFQIGTDEHGIKIQRTAEKEGISPKELVDRNVPLFEELYARLNVSSDFFIRTSDQAAHWPTVIELWKKLAEAGVLEKRSYTGLYCSGCERFMTKRDLVDGVCPNHQRAPEEVIEENWFLKMSEYGEQLRSLLTGDWDGESYRILPEFRSKETLSLIDSGLEDVSFSRPVSSLSWGVPVPGDEGQTMYVWCDALTNYISGLGYFTAHEEREWWDDAEVTHVIGKDIARFHALIWPLMLKKAGVRTPDELLIHGFLTSEGEKMSKSLGNVVVPTEVLDRFGGNPDPIRFYLSHEIPLGQDGDFSWERFEALYDSALRNKIGNMLNRVLVLFNKYKCGISLRPNSSNEDIDKYAESIIQQYVDTNPIEFDEHWWRFYSNGMDGFYYSMVMQFVLQRINDANSLIDKSEPWKQDNLAREYYLSVLCEILRHIALMLLPFVPDTAYRMSKQLNVPYAEEMLAKEFVITDEMKTWGGMKDWKTVGTPEILFPPLDKKD